MNQDSQSQAKSSFKPAGKWIVGSVSAAAIATAALGFQQVYQFRAAETSASPTPTAPNAPKAVSALGRLEPQGEIISLSAPSSLEGARIKELRVEAGSIVRAGETIAILDNIGARQAALEQAEKQVEVSRMRLAQVEAGAKAGEIAAQKATVARLEAQLKGEKIAQEAAIARLTAQLQREKEAQNATVERLKAQLREDKKAQEAKLAKLKNELQGDRKAQQATYDRVKVQQPNEIAAKEATIARLQAELNNARAELKRYDDLHEQGVISTSVLDSKRLTLETVQKQLIEEEANLNKILAISPEQIAEEEAKLNKIVGTGEKQLIEEQATLDRIVATGQKQVEEAEANLKKTVETLQQQINEAEATRTKTIATLQQEINEAKATLDRISEVRPVDVEAARSEVDSAIAAVEKAKADLDQSYVKAPTDGQILKIHARPGEVVGNKGIADMGQTSQMFVAAEIYESDIDKIRLGQRATITSGALAGELKGSVAQIGLQIGKKDVLDTDPAADVDARVVEVKIRLDKQDSKRVAGLTNMQVEVKIYL